MLFVDYNPYETVAVYETVAAIEVEHHLQVTCQTLAEVSAGGVWVEMRIVPYACWQILFPNNKRMV